MPQEFLGRLVSVGHGSRDRGIKHFLPPHAAEESSRAARAFVKAETADDGEMDVRDGCEMAATAPPKDMCLDFSSGTLCASKRFGRIAARPWTIHGPSQAE